MNGFIYFVRRSNGSFKIGFSTDVEKRIITLQTSSDVPLRLIGYVTGSKKLERQIHRVLAPYRMSGEWFKDCFGVKTFISNALSFGISCALGEEFGRNVEREWQSSASNKRTRLDFLKSRHQ